MSFLQLGALWALPLIVMPIVIHLIHGHRHPTTEWAAMMFLQRAMDARRGPTKIRRWLILLLRMLVVAGLVFALARPLSSGLFGVAAGRLADSSTAIVLVDRSPSMRLRLPDGRTRLQASIQEVTQTLTTLGVSEVVLIESVSAEPVLIQDPGMLSESSLLLPADSTSEVAELFARATDYLIENDLRFADIWVCSDRQSIDWQEKSARWNAVAAKLGELDAEIRLYETVFPEAEPINASVVVTKQRTVVSEQGRAVEVSFRVTRSDDSETEVPVRVSVGAVTETSRVRVKEGSGQGRVRVPVDELAVPGVVSIAADANTSDDRFYFVAGANESGRVGVLLGEPSVALEVAAEVLGGSSSPAEKLERLDCLICLGKVADAKAVTQVQEFLDSGGQVVFFPGSDAEPPLVVPQISWKAWVDAPSTGSSFAEIEFSVDSYAAIEGDVVKLAQADNDEVLIGRRRVGKGTAYFCGCDVIHGDSVFVRDGVVLYGLLSEALSSRTVGAPDSGSGIGETAGRTKLPLPGQTVRVVRGDSKSAIEFGEHAGIYELFSGDGVSQGLVAFNRPGQESLSPPLSEQTVRGLVAGVRWIDFPIRSDADSDGNGIVRELWGAIWVLAVAVMLVESWLSLPGRVRGVTE